MREQPRPSRVVQPMQVLRHGQEVGVEGRLVRRSGHLILPQGEEVTVPLLHLGVGREGGFAAPGLAGAHADHLVLDEAGEGDGAMPEEGEGIVDALH